MFRRRQKDLVLKGEWTGELWDVKPITVPASLDVAEFLAAEPVPLIWPDDALFARTMEPDENMRRLWVVVFLHHPSVDVVTQALESPYLDSSILHAVSVADLLAEGLVQDRASAAIWRMDDHGVAAALTMLLDRGALPSGHSRSQSRRALEWLTTTCPPERREFFEDQLN